MINTLLFLHNHPLSKGRRFFVLKRYIEWQLFTKISRAPLIFEFVNDTKLVMEKGVNSACGNYYVGLYSFEEMSFLCHLLRKNDVFVDVGANIGAFSILASGVCGAVSHAFEPANLSYFQMLRNIKINNLERLVFPSKMAIGEGNGEIEFIENGASAINHIRYESDLTALNCSVVSVVALDNVLKNIYPALIKVDTEGWESVVFRGAIDILKSNNLKAIIVEMKGYGVRYGLKEAELFNLLISNNFIPCKYDPFLRKLSALETNYNSFNNSTEIFCRDIEYVQDLLTNAKSFIVNGISI